MAWYTAPLHTQLITAGLAGIVVGALGLAMPTVSTAQGGQAIQAAPQDTLALTVQPREMATATHNPAAGAYLLDVFPWYTVTVPPQCAGARRCPLFLFLPGAGQPSSVITAWLRPVAERHGLILLAASDGKYHPLMIDLALKETLQRFAIDPAKIAIIGRCASGEAAIKLGIHNLHVFSRIVEISGAAFPSSGPVRPTTLQGLAPTTSPTAEFLIDGGILELGRGHLALANELRQRGHPVRVTSTIRGHEHQAEDYDLMGRWLAESWAKPPAERAIPAVIDPLPLLTTEAVAKLTTFWTSFFKEPEWLRVTARRTFIRDFAMSGRVLVPTDSQENFGDVRPIIPMTDMAAFAAQYPSVAAALERAGLTGQEHDAYRLALLTAWIVSGGISGGGSVGVLYQWEVDPKSVMGKNVAFLAAHADEVQALTRVGIEDKEGPFATDGWQCCAHPKLADELRPLGIWRTP